MSRQHKGRFEKSAEILHSLLVGKKWQKRIELHQVFLFWVEAVGREIASHAEPVVIHGTVLWIGVSDSVWMQQLHLQKMLLLEKLNSRLKEDKLSDLRFQLDVHAGIAHHEPKIKEGKKRKKTSPLPRELENMISLLDKEEMQETLRNLWRKANEKEPGEG
jgi:predicted nucleic acid-binding Zn ribbon protein